MPLTPADRHNADLPLGLLIDAWNADADLADALGGPGRVRREYQPGEAPLPAMTVEPVGTGANVPETATDVHDLALRVTVTEAATSAAGAAALAVLEANWHVPLTRPAGVALPGWRVRLLHPLPAGRSGRAPSARTDAAGGARLVEEDATWRFLVVPAG